MPAAALVDEPVKVVSWSGRVLTGIAVAFMILDGITHIVKPAAVVDAFAQLGFPIRLAVGLGILELVCTALYAVPRTAFIGALLLTGYLGGAIATQLRAGSAWFPTIFPLIIAALVWGGLALRDTRVRALTSL